MLWRITELRIAPTKGIERSECASLEHTFKECHTGFKKCIYCEQDHRARAMRCPESKWALKIKQDNLRLQREARSSTSYSAAASSNTNRSLTPPISTTHQTTSLICLLNAHLHNVARHGTFQGILSEALALNGLRDVKLPHAPPSTEIPHAFGVSSLRTPPGDQAAETQSSCKCTSKPSHPCHITDQISHRNDFKNYLGSPAPSFSGEFTGEVDILETEEEEQTDILRFNIYRKTERPLHQATDPSSPRKGHHGGTS